jgi:hypothetical protein
LTHIPGKAIPLRLMATSNDSPITPSAGRFIGGVFGFAFAGIGLTVLVFLWAAPFGEFESPPIVFRLFGSFIALVFVAVGGTVLVGSIKGRTAMDAVAPRVSFAPTTTAATPSTGYNCPHCGAPLPEKADVSPLGDAKCPFCHTWFNIHQKTV